MYKVDLALRKKKETKLECYEEKCGTFELTIAVNTLKFCQKNSTFIQLDVALILNKLKVY